MKRRRRPSSSQNLSSFKEILLQVPAWLSLVSLLAVVYDIGFDQSKGIGEVLRTLYFITLILGILLTVGRHFWSSEKPSLGVAIWDIFSLLFMSLVMVAGCLPNKAEGFFSILQHPSWMNTAIFIVFLREFPALRIHYKRSFLNPAQVFIFSFIIIILLGGLLLMLPRATHHGISFLDALFTSTSAVCVTGLIVVDTATHFTSLGHWIIMFLIQIGGLGIMTFASYFSYFFRGGSSYDNQLMIGSLTNADKMGEVFAVLKVILLTTLVIEGTGAMLIYVTLDPLLLPHTGERIFFAIFHSISGFCNAGFSTLTQNLYDPGFRYNYSLHIIVAFLLIIGGLGFPIAFNLVRTFRQLIHVRWMALIHGRRVTFTPWLLNLSTRIVLITSLILIVVGTVFVFIFEYQATLADHALFGKIVTAFFTATSPRTAGFNTVDMTAMSFSTLMILLLLMWIGASPGSTGGGIKTSTFAVGTLNFLSLARGKNRIEVYRREISDITVRRAFAIISLSLVMIGMGTFLLATFEGHQDLLNIAFECFSAYSTVGLSIGLTPELSDPGKVVVMFLMFAGRVGMLTILIAIFRRVKNKSYRYPTEEILIN